jgi:hypothetical protein
LMYIKNILVIFSGICLLPLVLIWILWRNIKNLWFML